MGPYPGTLKGEKIHNLWDSSVLSGHLLGLYFMY